MQESKVARAVALAVGVALGVTQLVHADDAEWYVGVGAGRSVSKLNDSRIATELNAPVFTTASIETDTHKNAW